MNVLIDTCVWSLAFRRRPENLSSAERIIVRELSDLIREGRARIIGLVRQELLSGVRSSAQFELLRSTMRPFIDEPLSTEDHELVAKTGNACRAKGLRVSLVDVLLCAVAASRDWALFSTDPDFTRYARIFTLKLHVPRK